MRTLVAALLVVCASTEASGQVKAGRRLALVIGNQAYREAPLDTPAQDATDIRALLTEAGFAVSFERDLSLQSFRTVVNRFADSVRRGDTVVFYYAGHGIEVRGKNYLPAIEFDFRGTREAEVDDKAVSINNILFQVREKEPGTLIVILDACRNNPLKGNRGASDGLAEIFGGAGEYIAFATGPGKTASDRSAGARNGLFTKYLLQHARRLDLDVNGVFDAVRANVHAESNGTQTPWSNSGLLRPFFFRSDGAAPPKPSEPGPPDPRTPSLDACAGLSAPQSEAELVVHAKCAITARRWSEAVRHLNAAIAKNGGNAEYLGLRAAAHQQLQQYPLARADLERAIRLDPSSAVYPFALGRLLLTLEEYTEAENALLTARELAPERKDVCLTLAQAMDYTGQKKPAADLRVACERPGR